MHTTKRTDWALSLLGTTLAMAGCGGGTGAMMTLPISVSLGSSTVVVSQDGAPTRVQITIGSTRETALVSFVGLPAGVKVTYAATDTNPSGLLTFTATAAAAAGTYRPMVTIDSAGQTASTGFTLIVSAAAAAT